jgi:hypothetical protein
MTYEIHVLYNGYSKMTDEGMVADCTCTLIKGPKLIIVDTMTPWDKEKIVAGSIYLSYSFMYWSCISL